MNGDSALILVVEDDPQIQNLIAYLLSKEGFSYAGETTAQGALDAFLEKAPDLVLLDLALPDFDGTEVIRRLRETSKTPIIVVSARKSDQDKANAFDLGADDYLVKPFSTTELLARIRVALRHFSLYRDDREIGDASAVRKSGRLSLDLAKRLFYVDGVETHTTPMEYRLLTLFLQNPGAVISTAEILQTVWGANYGNDTQALRTLISGLRKKIEHDPAFPRCLLTETGVGYRLCAEKPCDAPKKHE